jgi:bis(5'-nucleosyl)-tetraphosphatase (symmetrical)
MATFAIGDLQGCYTSFQNLLKQFDFSPSRDRLWLVGDLINRGPDSLKMLRWLMANEDAVTTVLGNHDLHALAVHEGYVSPHRKDTLDELLKAPDRKTLFDWLRKQPLAFAEDQYMVIHAGLLPQWTTTQAVELATEVQDTLRSKDYRSFLEKMYGNRPIKWSNDLSGMSRLRLITNALTRLRVCTPDGKMEFSFKGELADVPPDLTPWFDAPKRKSQDTTLIVGHWSALGLLLRDDLFALDTGCLWGGKLTALRVEDRQVFQVPRAAEDSV